ncbi:MAG: ATP-binding cassette domain-containing protein [Silvanigrellales bacterium]|nr:ATP-binding cassette domain-containing protein [Silvanigrellales bacterium]
MTSMMSVSLSSFSYGRGPEVLREVHFSLPSGARVFLLGPSGCGKSTLLRILMGLERGARGHVLQGQTTFDFSGWGPSQQAFSLVPQVPCLFPWKTVEENLLVAFPGKQSAAKNKERVHTLLAAVGLSESAHRYPWEISQGMASRVSFARAQIVSEVHGARCLLLDEPFAALDALTRSSLQRWLRLKLEDSAMPCLFVTHDVREALSLGTRILVLGQPQGKSAFTVVSDYEGFQENDEWEARVISSLSGASLSRARPS